MKIFGLLEFDVCESTNDEAWKLFSRTGDSAQAPAEDFCPTVVVAHRQNKGRGRQGRAWQSQIEGNILASLAMQAPERNLGWLPLAAGVAAIEATHHACQLAGAGVDASTLEGLRLKWPNDVMWNDAKLGGILCESRFTGERAVGAVVGMGLNVAGAPAIGGLKTASLVQDALAGSGGLANPALVAAMRWFLIREWALRLLSWSAELSDEREGGLERLRAAWKKFARLDRFASLTVHDRSGLTVRLKALDLDADGRLRAVAENGAIVHLNQADSMS